MEALSLLLLGLTLGFVSAHYDGYPFEHKNEGRYGAAHPYANYGPADAPRQEDDYSVNTYGPILGGFLAGYGYGGRYVHGGYLPYFDKNGYHGVYYGGLGNYKYYGHNHGFHHGDHEINNGEDHQGYVATYPAAAVPAMEDFTLDFPEPTQDSHYEFLGMYGGDCDAERDNGLYVADERSSFVVCVHGRAHRFQCPKGTLNRAFGDLQHEHKYNINELCGVNTLPTK